MKKILFIPVIFVLAQSCIESQSQKVQTAVGLIKQYKVQAEIKDSLENMFVLVDPDFTDNIVTKDGVKSVDERYRRKYFKYKPMYDLLIEYDSFLKVLPTTRVKVKMACDEIRDNRISDSLLVNILNKTSY